MRVRVYWNLHKKCFSVVNCKTGRVIDHSDEVHLLNVDFKVREGGRQRVLKEGRKNVHAFVEGDRIPQARRLPRGSAFVTYNPYYHKSFIRRQRGTLVHEATEVAMVGGRKPLLRAWGAR